MEHHPDPKEGAGKHEPFCFRVGGSSMQFADPETTYRTLSLSVWVLKGPADTWRGQLEEYYRKEPVFALLGGIVIGYWKPIQDFCEANRLSNLFP